jgi:hypothetical protein
MEVLASVLDPELAEVDIAAIEKLASGTDIQDIDAAAESCELQLPLRFDSAPANPGFLGCSSKCDGGCRSHARIVLGENLHECHTFFTRVYLLCLEVLHSRGRRGRRDQLHVSARGAGLRRRMASQRCAQDGSRFRGVGRLCFDESTHQRGPTRCRLTCESFAFHPRKRARVANYGGSRGGTRDQTRHGVGTQGAGGTIPRNASKHIPALEGDRIFFAGPFRAPPGRCSWHSGPRLEFKSVCKRVCCIFNRAAFRSTQLQLYSMLRLVVPRRSHDVPKQASFGALPTVLSTRILLKDLCRFIARPRSSPSASRNVSLPSCLCLVLRLSTLERTCLPSASCGGKGS